MWPSPPLFQHRLSPLFSGPRRCRGGGLFVPARVLSVSSSFICRNTSAKSFSTSLRVVTAAAAASVSLPAVGSKSSKTVLTEATLALSVVSSLTTRSSLTATSTASDFVSRSAHLRERLREEPAQVTSEHPHAFASLLFPPEELGEKPL
ncbi:hypothetical protein T12_2157 [Trichinella patagoniensis]|uniref:Uncharacterized protein n=1 Tax=Trichinella patagoniensis TaxID=990121 RepID=A0A0V0Z2I5_9BILA|nr:hypothetical protein T12_1610 [Trichinella patagoniensis]KRY06538.1 hypothetical protein T12_15453 [Trichinella patagoniensis]KRY06672.1 hypothetical protein T12_13044 [Trichinella patagoniensis]KRY07125.1 hypothetical protein T12_9585 [Trichinella patagoniensis]KRY07129.1 hypothetical protein T12_2787 [Trichinella patagoniensis]